MCGARSSASSDQGPSTGLIGAFASPAWKICGSPVTIGLISSGELKTTERPKPGRSIVNGSP